MSDDKKPVYTKQMHVTSMEQVGNEVMVQIKGQAGRHTAHESTTGGNVVFYLKPEHANKLKIGQPLLVDILPVKGD